MEASAKPAVTPSVAEPQWFGHPRGISNLFFVEMWERFSYYGMRAFLILYMTAPATLGGLGFDNTRAGNIYGYYTSSAWMATIGGGLIADWFLGQYRSVLVGAILITLGHFTLAFHELSFFYAGLILIAVGTGFLKPNASTLVGSCYEKGDPRRDAGFSIFYMGINVGAASGPLIAGYLAQNVDWHLGFACAGVGMTIGLIQFIFGRKYLQPAIDRMKEQARQAKAEIPAGSSSFSFTKTEWMRLAAVFVLFLFASIFWGAYEQAGSTLNLFARDYTRLSVLGHPFPSSWFQSVPAIFVITMAPLFAWMWMRLGSKEPSSPAKFTIGLLCVGLSFFLLVPGARFAQSALGVRVSPMWLVAVYFLQVAGELCVSPVGLSVVTKLAPQRIVGIMMGVWLLSIAMGDIIAGKLAGYFATYPLPQLFGYVAITATGAAIVLFLMLKPIKKLMGGIN